MKRFCQSLVRFRGHVDGIDEGVAVANRCGIEEEAAPGFGDTTELGTELVRFQSGIRAQIA